MGKVLDLLRDGPKPTHAYSTQRRINGYEGPLHYIKDGKVIVVNQANPGVDDMVFSGTPEEFYADPGHSCSLPPGNDYRYLQAVMHGQKRLAVCEAGWNPDYTASSDGACAAIWRVK